MASSPDVKLEQVAAWKQYGGWNRRYKFKSATLGNTDTVRWSLSKAVGVAPWPLH